MQKIAILEKECKYTRLGNWAGPRDLFPTLEIHQQSSQLTISYWEINDHQRGMYGRTHSHTTSVSTDGQVVRITGLCGLRNDQHRVGGRQSFCFFVFRGDSGHIYTHRARATAGWVTCDPEKLLHRLRKLGLGRSDTGVIQQGDFLLRPANGQGYADEAFKHESMGAGHHGFLAPVLYHDGARGRQYRVTEPVTLRHTAVDGIRHPDVLIPVGKYYIGTTSVSLATRNMRD